MNVPIPSSAKAENVPVAKSSSGIRGLDEITNGGFPTGRSTLVAGGPGSGKTILALQTLVTGAKNGEPGIFVAFEEGARRIVANASSFGWNLPELEKQGLFFLDAKPRPDAVIAGEFDLVSMLASIKAKADLMGAKRIVFDSIDVLLSLLDNPVAERRELFRLNEWLLETGLTGLITSKNSDSSLSSLRYQEFMQYMMDCMITLRHDVDNRVGRRTLRVVKYRGSGFYAGEVALILNDSGVEVVSFPVSSVQASSSIEKLSSGIERLDTMLGGGYYRGAAVLLSGAPGTAKTTLCGCFILAACQRGESSLFVGFDEPAHEVVRNLRSVGIDLEPYIASGLLHMHSIRSSLCGAEEHIGTLRNLLDAYQPRCLVIDPLSAIINSDPEASQRRMPEQLLALTKGMGVTVVCSSLLSGNDALNEGSSIQVSTVADTWIHISYTVLAGERNRAITIVKSRGTDHSNQVRELVLSADGVTLKDVYRAGGEVLMGTARWEKEAEEQASEELHRIEIERKRVQLELAQAEVNVRMEVLTRELEIKRQELQRLESVEQIRQQSVLQRRETLQALRSADKAGH
jgi:circadian clock protein KaiC